MGAAAASTLHVKLAIGEAAALGFGEALASIRNFSPFTFTALPRSAEKTFLFSESFPSH